MPHPVAQTEMQLHVLHEFFPALSPVSLLDYDIAETTLVLHRRRMGSKVCEAVLNPVVIRREVPTTVEEVERTLVYWRTSDWTYLKSAGGVWLQDPPRRTRCRCCDRAATRDSRGGIGECGQAWITGGQHRGAGSRRRQGRKLPDSGAMCDCSLKPGGRYVQERAHGMAADGHCQLISKDLFPCLLSSLLIYNGVFRCLVRRWR